MAFHCEGLSKDALRNGLISDSCTNGQYFVFGHAVDVKQSLPDVRLIRTCFCREGFPDVCLIRTSF